MATTLSGAEYPRDNLYRYNLAFLRFRQCDYTRRAMPLLRQVDAGDLLNNLDARHMLLRIYYELQEWDALKWHLQSFGTCLRGCLNLPCKVNSNSLSGDRRTSAITAAPMKTSSPSPKSPIGQRHGDCSARAIRLPATYRSLIEPSAMFAEEVQWPERLHLRPAVSILRAGLDFPDPSESEPIEGMSDML